MSFATDLQEVAYDLLSELGQAITGSRDVEGNFDPTSGSTIGITNSSYTGYGHPGMYTTQEIDGTVVLGTDIKLSLYSTTEPLIGDILTLDSVAHRAMNVRKVKAQGANIYYIVQLRV